jgi:hypothetical protein
MFAVQVEVHQREVSAQPMMALCDASIVHLVEAEDYFKKRNISSTLALTRDFVVFLRRVNSSA